MVKCLRVSCLFILCAAAVLAAETVCHASPKVQVDQSVYDAGAVPEGRDAVHEFILRNVGDQDLIIKPKPC